MYVIDFFKRMTRISNIPVLIYLVLNILVIGVIVQMAYPVVFWKAVLIGLGLYVVSVSIALSPIGEFILRVQTGCKKIKRLDQKNRIEPLFEEVYNKAKLLDSSIPNGVKLYISEDQSPNAFATGRKTICVTEGLLHMHDDQIRATLAHEFGHLAHKDTDLILIVSIGNLVITTVLLGLRIVIMLFQLFFSLVCIFIGGSEGALAAIVTSITSMLINLLVVGGMWIWTKIGILLVMKSSRSNEYEADGFAYEMGFGDDLCVLLDSIIGTCDSGLFANLVSSHPNKDHRIAKLQALGATYKIEYGNYLELS